VNDHDPLDGIDTDVLVDVLADLAASDHDSRDHPGWSTGLATLVAATYRPGERSELTGEEHVVAAMADVIRSRPSDAPGRPHTGLTVRRAVAAKTIAVTAIALGVATAAAAGVTVSLVVPDGGGEPRQRSEPVATTFATEHDDGDGPGTVTCEPNEVCRSRDPAEPTSQVTEPSTTTLPATTARGRADDVDEAAGAPSTVEPGAAADDTPSSSVPTSPTTTDPSVPLADPDPQVEHGPPDGAGPPVDHGPPDGAGPPVDHGPPDGAGPPIDHGPPGGAGPPDGASPPDSAGPGAGTADHGTTVSGVAGW